MKIPTIVSLLFLCFIGQQAGVAQSDSPNIWGKELEAGPHRIGFRTLFKYDQARAAIPFSDWDGKLTYLQEEDKGRQMQINIWYPAKPRGTTLPYGHYIELMGKQVNFSIDDQESAKQIFIDQTNALGGNGEFTREALESIAKLRTTAYLNAPAINEKFPVLIFPNGGSPAYQSIMCEYIASHGYVVAAVSLKGQYSSTVDASAKGLEIAADDLKYTLNQLLLLDNIDRNRIALMANAIESSMCTALAAKNKLIKALISLEGGLLSSFEQRLLRQTNFYTPSAIQVPILAIYAPHPAISPEYINQLKYSDRYFAHFPGMTEFHFLSYGILETEVPGIIGTPKGDTKKGFIWAARLSRMFLDAMLKNETQSRAFFRQFAIPSTATGVIDTAFTLPAIPSPPNITLLKNLFINKGMQAIDSVYQAFKIGDAQVFPLPFYSEFRDWLAWKKDPDYQFRAQLYEMAVESFPNSSVAHYYRAYFAEKIGELKLARKNYQLALNLVPEDQDPDLTNAKRKTLQELAEKAILRL